MFKPFSVMVFATVTFLWFTMAYRLGNWEAKGALPSQRSSQKRVPSPSPTWNEPNLKKVSF
jgi:hypothetical protein